GMGLLPQQITDELLDAYLFLRNAEHALQGVADQQTQTLPDDDFPRLRMACIMNFDNWQAFEEKLDHHRNRAAEHFANVIAAPDDEEENDQGLNAELRAIWQG
ncbi:bifunctional glutamine synthetase adenylyltransferase/deadenyltransferase, partial [Oceanospirillum sp. D5]|nr:bifunctional glutamine synthetase adenylyltransferase/deadenyltransferase [Oceanospirillum sediminis]